MLCPTCNQNLSPVSLKNNQDKTIELDYCPNCAGIWSDQGETNFLKPRDLDPLYLVLPKNPYISGKPYELYVCPRDSLPLRIYKRESIPNFLNILRCNKCGGYFFPNGTLPQFKDAQDAKVNYFKKWSIPLTSVYAVLLPLLIITILGGGIIAGLIGMQKTTQTQMQAKDLISRPTVLLQKNGGVFIAFTSQIPLTTKIKYWENPEKISEAWISQTLTTNHQIYLSDLKISTAYSYQIISLSPQSLITPVYTFITTE